MSSTQSNGGIMKKLRSGILVLVALAVLIAGQSVAMAKQDSFLTGPERKSLSYGAESMATLKLPTGESLDFVAMQERKGTIGFMVFSTLPPNTPGYQMMERLQGANALEIYNALSERGTEIPRELVDVYGRSVMGPQGWALGDLAADLPGSTYTPPCPAWGVQNFNDALAYGMNNYSDNFTSTWDGPNAKPNHWHKAANTLANGIATKDLYGQAFNVTGFSTAVVLCHTDAYNYVGGTYAGNFVNVKYRIADLPWWFVYEAGQLDEIGKVVSAQFHPANFNHMHATEYHLRLEILNAEENDLFHIGATWHEKVGDLTFGQ
jgi:hypothetical protein